MAHGTMVLAVFLGAMLAGLAGLFLYGWLRRREKMPDVPPLPRDDDWD
jgi:ABC-type uncharacterized transport system permease subunit